MDRQHIQVVILTLVHGWWRGCDTIFDKSDYYSRRNNSTQDVVHDFRFYFNDCLIVSTLMLTLIQSVDVPLLVRRLCRLLVVALLLRLDVISTTVNNLFAETLLDFAAIFLPAVPGEQTQQTVFSQPSDDVTPGCGIVLLIGFAVVLKHTAMISYRNCTLVLLAVPLLNPLTTFLEVSASSGVVVVTPIICMLPRLCSVVFICRRLSHGFNTINDQRVLPSVLSPHLVISPLGVCFLMNAFIRLSAFSYFQVPAVSEHSLINGLACIFDEARYSPIACLGLAACVVHAASRQLAASKRYVVNGNIGLVDRVDDVIDERITPLAISSLLLTFSVVHFWPAGAVDQPHSSESALTGSCLILAFISGTTAVRLSRSGFLAHFEEKARRGAVVYLHSLVAVNALAGGLIVNYFPQKLSKFQKPIGMTIIVAASVVGLSFYVTQPVARMTQCLLRRHARHLSDHLQQRIIVVFAKLCELTLLVVAVLIWIPDVGDEIRPWYAHLPGPMLDVFRVDVVVYVRTTYHRLKTRLIAALVRRRSSLWNAILSSFEAPPSNHPGLGDVCAVCFCNIQRTQQHQQPSTDEHRAVLTPCGHVFHYSCLLEWVKVQLNCPMCRTKFTLQDEWLVKIVDACYQLLH